MARLSCIVAIISVTLMCVLAQERYSDKYDNLDVHAVLADDKLRNEYMNCYLDIGPCVKEDQKFFKGIINEIIQTECQKCTEKLKEMYKTSKDWMMKNEPANWAKLVAKSAEDMKKKNAGQ